MRHSEETPTHPRTHSTYAHAFDTMCICMFTHPVLHMPRHGDTITHTTKSCVHTPLAHTAQKCSRMQNAPATARDLAESPSVRICQQNFHEMLDTSNQIIALQRITPSYRVTAVTPDSVMHRMWDRAEPKLTNVQSPDARDPAFLHRFRIEQCHVHESDHGMQILNPWQQVTVDHDRWGCSQTNKIN